MDIAFLGLGRMGRELVPHLIDAGHRVTAWNRSPGPAETIGRRGARVAGSAAEAVEEAEVVVTVLFVVNLLIRWSADDDEVSIVGFILSLLGLAALGASGWLGGKLAYHYGVRVADEMTQSEGFR